MQIAALAVRQSAIPAEGWLAKRVGILSAKGKSKDPPIQVTPVGLAFVAGREGFYPELVDPVSRARTELALAEIGHATSREEADRRASAFCAQTHARYRKMVEAALTKLLSRSRPVWWRLSDYA